MNILQASIDGHIVIPRITSAYSIWERVKGLLGRPGLPEGEALHISPCGSIHTLGMRFALDVVFLDKESRICRTVWNVSPCRVIIGGSGAKSVLEMETGWLNKDIFSAGKVLEIEGVK